MPPGAEPLVVEVRRGGRILRAEVSRQGRDLVVAVGGGERPHVGCVVLARPRPSTADPGRTSATVSVLAIPPHKEEAIARPLAEALAVATGGTVVVSAGVHEEGLDAGGVAAWLRLARELERRLLEALRRAP